MSPNRRREVVLAYCGLEKHYTLYQLDLTQETDASFGRAICSHLPFQKVTSGKRTAPAMLRGRVLGPAVANLHLLLPHRELLLVAATLDPGASSNSTGQDFVKEHHIPCQVKLTSYRAWMALLVTGSVTHHTCPLVHVGDSTASRTRSVYSLIFPFFLKWYLNFSSQSIVRPSFFTSLVTTQ